jgi:signal transduction histidine kinase
MKFKSIRSQVIILFIPLIVIPLLLAGIIGALYFQDVLKHNIWEDDLAQAKSLSVYVNNYIISSVDYLEGMAYRTTVINGVEANNSSVLNIALKYGENNSQFYSIFITDTSGKVISSYPPSDRVGLNYSDQPYVNQVLSTHERQVLGPLANRTGQSTIYISVPIVRQDGALVGVMFGTIDPDRIGDQILYAQAKNLQYIYMVNSTGNVIVHTNRSYMSSRANFSSIPAVQWVTHGKEGVEEQYNPIEGIDRLAAYSPVKSLGWGVVVAIPTSIVYQPVTNMLWWIGALILALIAVSLALAYAFSKSITDPILGLFEAARAITKRREYKQYLPLDRKDEIGQVAACIDRMAQRIGEDREKIMSERDRAEDERKRAELYMDIMGHDINNLNQTVLGNLELIRDEPGLTEDEKESIDKSMVATRSSAAIINNVRKLQKLSEEKLSHEILDINDLILECIKEAPRPEGKNIKFNYAPRKGILIKCIPLAKEVFCNLLNNSIKYSGPEVTIDIETGDRLIQGKKYYYVAVSDNGFGISDDVKPRLFARFQRGTTKAHGKGLGLYIVKSILEKCDGSVTVEDRIPGDYSKGAKFIVTIPAAEGGVNGKA